MHVSIGLLACCPLYSGAEYGITSDGFFELDDLPK